MANILVGSTSVLGMVIALVRWGIDWWKGAAAFTAVAWCATIGLAAESDLLALAAAAIALPLSVLVFRHYWSLRRIDD